MLPRLLTAACLASALLATAAQAQEKTTAPAELAELRAEMAQIRERLALSCRVAIFDLERILAESKQGHALEQELNTFHVTRRAELEALDAELMTLAKRFEAEQALLSDEERTSRGNVLLAKRRELGKATQEAAVELERRRSEGVQAIGRTVGEIGIELAKERQLDLILDRTVPLVASSRLDVTDEILLRLASRAS